MYFSTTMIHLEILCLLEFGKWGRQLLEKELKILGSSHRKTQVHTNREYWADTRLSANSDSMCWAKMEILACFVLLNEPYHEMCLFCKSSLTLEFSYGILFLSYDKKAMSLPKKFLLFYLTSSRLSSILVFSPRRFNSSCYFLLRKLPTHSCIYEMEWIIEED